MITVVSSFQETSTHTHTVIRYIVDVKTITINMFTILITNKLNYIQVVSLLEN